jgi:hypothetical protein
LSAACQRGLRDREHGEELEDDSFQCGRRRSLRRRTSARRPAGVVSTGRARSGTWGPVVPPARIRGHPIAHQRNVSCGRRALGRHGRADAGAARGSDCRPVRHDPASGARRRPDRPGRDRARGLAPTTADCPVASARHPEGTGPVSR